MDRVRRARDRFVDFVLRDVEEISGAERIRRQSSFVDKQTLVVAGHIRRAGANGAELME